MKACDRHEDKREAVLRLEAEVFPPLRLRDTGLTMSEQSDDLVPVEDAARELCDGCADELWRWLRTRVPAEGKPSPARGSGEVVAEL